MYYQLPTEHNPNCSKYPWIGLLSQCLQAILQWQSISNSCVFSARLSPSVAPLGELPDVQGLKVVSFLGPLAQMVDRDAACAKAVMALCAEITVEVASEATGGAAGSKHKKVGRSMVRSGGRIKCFEALHGQKRKIKSEYNNHIYYVCGAEKNKQR